MYNAVYGAIYLFVFICGACIGSFTNVLIYRIPRNLPFVYDTSACPECKKRIMPHDLIPIASYIALKGKCRHCSSRISPRYPLIELLCGILAVLAVKLYSFTPSAALYFAMFILLVAVAFIDIDFMIIPDGLVIALAITAIAIAVSERDISLLWRILGAFVLSAPMAILNLFIKEAFGDGDIKLLFVCGFALGFRLVILCGFIAVVLGGIHGVCIIAAKKKYKDTHIPFGQYICIGAFIAQTLGEKLLAAYFALFMP